MPALSFMAQLINSSEKAIFVRFHHYRLSKDRWIPLAAVKSGTEVSRSCEFVLDLDWIPDSLRDLEPEGFEGPPDFAKKHAQELFRRVKELETALEREKRSQEEAWALLKGLSAKIRANPDIGSAEDLAYILSLDAPAAQMLWDLTHEI